MGSNGGAVLGGVYLHRRSWWRKNIDSAKIDMGLRAPFTRDELDNALFTAVRERCARAIAELVAEGANPNLKMEPRGGGTVCSLLHAAVVGGDLRTVAALLLAGADPLALDAHGFTPRDYLVSARGQGRMKTLLARWEMRKLSPVNDDGEGGGAVKKMAGGG